MFKKTDILKLTVTVAVGVITAKIGEKIAGEVNSLIDDKFASDVEVETENN